ncbi:MAG: tetratricopeptide repeat protein [Thermoanaerobaculia bacterium]|nr:tetratricopeptide repeat protein [Thermoanaerobaculia bacterium]
MKKGTSWIHGTLFVGFALMAGTAMGSSLSVPPPARPTPEMVQWARARIPPSGSPTVRLGALVRALQSSSEIDLQYDADSTVTAREVFEEGRFNCLSFSHLFVGLARSLGMEVDYLEVEPLRFGKSGDLVLASGHVTVGFGTGFRRQILEIGSRPKNELIRARVIPDRRAHALHFANLGTEAFLDSRTEEATELLSKALSIEPELASAWTNLGVIRRRDGDLAGAEEAHRRAIEADGDHVAAYHNLFSLLLFQGRESAAREIESLLARSANRNPYAWLSLGEFTLEEDRLEDAQRFLRRAYRLAPREGDVLLARAELELERGELEKARKWLRRAEELTSDRQRLEELKAVLYPERTARVSTD